MVKTNTRNLIQLEVVTWPQTCRSI